MSTTLSDLLESLRTFSPQDLDWELRKYKAVVAWARKAAGLDFQEGDHVRIKEGFKIEKFLPDGHPHGWWSYRECLVPGATGTAGKIDFNVSGGYWSVDLTLDREWSGGGSEPRYWHGRAEDTPEDMKPPYKPEGDPSIFCFAARWIEADSPHVRPVKEATDA
jgi:hypothetical protein